MEKTEDTLTVIFILVSNTLYIKLHGQLWNMNSCSGHRLKVVEGTFCHCSQVDSCCILAVNSALDNIVNYSEDYSIAATSVL